MKKLIKVSVLSILIIVTFSLLIFTLSRFLGKEIYINKLNQFTPEETYKGIKDSFDNNVVPSLEESMEIVEEGLSDPEKVLDEFTEQ